MGLDLEYIDGQTPIDEDEKEGLLIETIATKEELDEFEQQTIEESIQWIFGKKFNAKDVFTKKFICNLHKRHYCNVGAWAGVCRYSRNIIGIARYQIHVAHVSL